MPSLRVTRPQGHWTDRTLEIFVMAFANCTGCFRRHKRPVNTRCEYLKSATEHCVSLRITTSEFAKYLPELLEEDMDPTFDYSAPMAGTLPSRPEVGVAGAGELTEDSMPTSLLRELVSENIKSRKLFESSQHQVERMMAQLLDLKISSQRSQSVGPVPPVITPVSTPVTTVTSTSPLYSVQAVRGPLMASFGGSTASSGAPWTSTPPGFFPLTTGGTWATQPTTTTPEVTAASTAAAAVTAAAASLTPGPFTWPAGAGLSAVPVPGVHTAVPAAVPVAGPTAAIPTVMPSTGPWAAAVQQLSAVKNPYLPPYLIPGASQRETVQIPYRCETDHHHPPRHACSSSTGKRKLTIFDLEIHMRYASSANATIDDVIAGSLSLLESMLRQGVDCTGYVKHIRFLVEKSKVYSQASLIGYDTEMRERAEYFGPSVFMYGDHDLTHPWLGVESLKQSVSAGLGTSNTGGAKKKTARLTRFGSCWGWNENKACKATPCKYKHVCSSCQGDHRQIDCTSKTTVSAKSSK